jgi:tRNA-modifying protein YgfZ
MDSSWNQALTERGARIEGNRVIAFCGAQPEPPPGEAASALTALLSQGLIVASGEDAQAFLQGQLSNDITRASRNRAQLAAYCTPKGRVLATLLVWNNDEGYALALPRELCDPIRKRLQMYVLRARVQLTDASERAALIGVVGSDAAVVVRSELGLALSSDYDVARNDGVTAVALPGGRVQVISDVAVGVQTWDQLARRCVALGEEVWDAHAIAAGVPAITGATQDQFTPHMLNLDLVGGVSFDKGCYTGQEIVARTQYLGQVKRRLARFATSARAAPGTAIYAGTSPVGLVVNTARSPTGEFEVLAVTQTQLTGSGTALRVGTQGAALRPLILPYPVPELSSRHESGG